MAFVLGSIPFGRIIGNLVARVDVREVGSRNIGATNVAREVGLRWGVVTLILDAMKGAVPVLAVTAMAGETRGIAEVSGLAAMVGHQFSPFLGFQGGKGVATALGIFLAMEPLVCAMALGVFIVVVAVGDMVSLGSMAAACSIPVFMFILGAGMERVGMAVAVAGLIILAHRGNIVRIMQGKERRWKAEHKS